jgi:hypothetical protein
VARISELLGPIPYMYVDGHPPPHFHVIYGRLEAAVPQNVKTVSMYPWLLIPGLFVVAAVLAYSLLGDGLRDTADPYSR